MEVVEPPQSPLTAFIAQMLGLPAWGAKQGYGSFLSFEFGPPELIVKERVSERRGRWRQAYVEGCWHVWIYCCHWRFCAHQEQIAWSEDSRDDIGRAAAMLDGQILTGVRIEPRKGKSWFEFDLGGVLETWPVGDDPHEEQWFIYAPEAVFKYRADGRYSKQPADTPRSEECWIEIR